MTTLEKIEAKYKLGLLNGWRWGDVTDGDGGVILFQGYNEVYEYGGATLELLGCTYCGITFDDMTEIMQELRKCNSTEV